MKAVTLVAPEVVEVTEQPPPTIESPGDAIVAVKTTAVCGTDLHAFRGHVPTVLPGTIMGHEFVGTVVEVGSHVTTYRPGDEVVGSDFTACGRCWWCRHGHHWQCSHRQVFGYGSTFGEPLVGAQAEMVRVPHADFVLHHRHPRISTEAAIFLTDTLATGYGASRRGDVRPGLMVAVVGAGTVGQMASLACQAAGAAAVVVVDLLEDRLECAARLGAVPATPDRARTVLDDLTDGRGADVVIEAVGGKRPLDTAIELVRPAGHVVSVGAHFDESWAAPVNRFFSDETNLSFMLGDPLASRDALTPLVAAGVIDPVAVISERATLEDAPGAYARFSAGETLKPILQVVP